MGKQVPVLQPVALLLRGMLKALASREERKLVVLVANYDLTKVRAGLSYHVPQTNKAIASENQATYTMMGMEDLMTYVEWVQSEGIAPLNKIKTKTVGSVVHDGVTYTKLEIYEVSVDDEVAAELPQYIIIDED